MAEDDFKTMLQAILIAEADAEMTGAYELAIDHAKHLKKKISADSPRRKNKRNGKHYADSWEIVKKDIKTKYVDYFQVVVKQKDYRNGGAPGLPHLLEKGHRIVLRKVAGGNYYLVDTGHKTRAIPHIFKNSEEEFEAYYRDLQNPNLGRAHMKRQTRKKGKD